MITFTLGNRSVLFTAGVLSELLLLSFQVRMSILATLSSVTDPAIPLMSMSVRPGMEALNLVS